MRAVIALLALVLIPSFAAAQPPPVPQVPGIPPPGAPPRRDASRPAATGTGRIRGRIVAADTGQPLRRAMVRIFGQELREGRSSTTDEQGRYELKDLPAGRYTVSASKSGFVTLNYGQLRPLEGGKPLQLGDNETADRIDLRLPRGSVITGRVVDEYGEPVANAMVQALQFRFMNGQKRPMNSSPPASTPDTGEFRLWGLGPGEYVISATLRDPMAMSGGSDDGRTGYAPTYYPNTPSVAEAQRVTVGVGATLSDLTIALSLTRTAKITGIAVDADGQPITYGFVSMMQRDSRGGIFMGGGGSQLRPDGTFTISNVVPGEYTLRAGTPPANPGAIAPSISQAQVTVDGQDVDGVRLSPLALSTVRGRLIVEAASAQTLRPELFRIMARPKRPEAMMGTPMAGPQPVSEAATFEFKAIPGSHFVQLMPTGQGTTFQVKSIRLAGLDITDEGLTVQGGEDINDLEIEITARVQTVSGTVTTRQGAAAADYTVIAFAQDPSTWPDQSPGRFGMTRPDQQGGFQLRSLRPGSYYIVAVEYVEQGQWTDPEYLETLRRHATSLTLGEAETKTVALKLAEEK